MIYRRKYLARTRRSQRDIYQFRLVGQQAEWTVLS